MPTHYRGNPEEILALDTVIKLTRGLNSLQARLMPHLQKDFGITESQFGVLEALLHLGPLSQGQLCQKILRSGSNLTTVVDNLERAGLVTRVRDAADRRVQIVQLTDEGRGLVTRAFPAHVARVADLMRALTTNEQRELGRMCRKLGRTEID
ncbi:MAG: MarR family transcriptional regulator [Gemmatimonadota bacterium]|nr:MarR family transcriptional regulator [Gemmatimonadota bacterium]